MISVLRLPIFHVVLRTIDRFVADDFASMIYIQLAVTVIGDAEEDPELHALRCVDAPFHNLDHISLATPVRSTIAP
jgi:hypothetical protein